MPLFGCIRENTASIASTRSEKPTIKNCMGGVIFCHTCMRRGAIHFIHITPNIPNPSAEYIQMYPAAFSGYPL